LLSFFEFIGAGSYGEALGPRASQSEMRADRIHSPNALSVDAPGAGE